MIRGGMRPIPILAVLAHAAAMALAAQVSLPMAPVPMTMQSYAVLLSGAALGPRDGVVATLLYLCAAAAGLPVLSDGTAGLERFAGPTAGYLFAFPLAAGLSGLAAGPGSLERPVRAIAMLTGLHVLILAMGATWLAASMGPAKAIAAGFAPFLPGAAVKSGLVVLTLRLVPGLRR